MVTQTRLTEQGAPQQEFPEELYLVRHKGRRRWTVFPPSELAHFDDNYEQSGPYSPEVAFELQSDRGAE